MILSLPADVRRWLAEIEKEEGVPPSEIAHHAILVFSLLTADERRRLTFIAMQFSMNRLFEGDRT